MRVCIESSIGKNVSSGPCAACNTVVNAMHLYFTALKIPCFPLFTFFLATANSCNYLYSFSFLLFTFLLPTRERRSP